MNITAMPFIRASTQIKTVREFFKHSHQRRINPIISTIFEKKNSRFEKGPAYDYFP